MTRSASGGSLTGTQLHIVLVQLPARELPRELADLDELWTRCEQWAQQTLDESGLGQCLDVDLSSELTSIAEVRDPYRATQRRSASMTVAPRKAQLS